MKSILYTSQVSNLSGEGGDGSGLGFDLAWVFTSGKLVQVDT
jgi:hypothetical protein